jgi:preprotein translocase subunit YajC
LDYNGIVLMGGGPEAAGGGTSAIFTIVWFALIIGAMYFLMIRPQRKKQKEHEKLLSELKKGDKVVTTGGLFGTIFAIDEGKGRIILRIDDQTKLEFLRSAIAGRVDS